MSNIYIQEPPTSGKVLLKTTVGDIELELWTREAPKACRNFIQLCMEGYYNGTIFHRVVKDFIVQGGDPTGTGLHGESVYGHPFKDEFHTRLRFCRRGLVAMANSGKNDNGSQFFFTLSATPELQNKHTIFGKIAGETIYNMLKLEEAEVDEDEKPLYPQKIIETEVLLNPFVDIVPRAYEEKSEKPQKVKNVKSAGVKNFKLLSFGEEAEEDEKEFTVLSKQYSGTSKSAHDNLSDPKLSAETGIITPEKSCSEKEREEEDNSDLENDNKNDEKREQIQVGDEVAEMRKRISDKLKEKKQSISDDKKKNSNEFNKTQKESNEIHSSDEEYYLGKDRDDERKRQVQAIRKEIKELKRGVRKDKRDKEILEEEKIQEGVKKMKNSELINEYKLTQEKYKEITAKVPKKGASREQFTLELLTSFRNKLKSMKEHVETTVSSNSDETKMIDDESEASWMTHALHCNEENLVLAKDANKKDDDWFEIYDPRNPINKRRRGEKVNTKEKVTSNCSNRNRTHQ